MEPVVVVGAGGHAKVIVDILLEGRRYEIAGCTAASPAPPDLLGIPVLGDDAVLPSLAARGIRNAFVALGDNRLRRDKARQIAAMGFALVNAVSPHAIISRRAALGCGVAVMPGVVINVAADIGDGAIVNTGATVDHDCRLGPFCHVAPGSSLAGCVRVGEGAFLGAGVRAVPGVSIGDWSIVGAGAVVIRDLPAHVTAVGIPAAIIKTGAREA